MRPRVHTPGIRVPGPRDQSGEGLFNDPASNISSAASFGQITSVLNTGAVGTGTLRRLQLMLRLEF